MIFIEMSRDEVHGGGGWAFPRCVWSPASRRDGFPQGYWNRILRIEDGDTVIHLRGIKPHAYFVGHSVALGGGFQTQSRPPRPRVWNYARSFFRANLRDFKHFRPPFNLGEIFEQRREALEAYYWKNRARQEKLAIFYNLRDGNLQCANGAYMSEADDELIRILFDDWAPNNQIREIAPEEGVEVGTRYRDVESRIGQGRFRARVLAAYRNQCCFPGCPVTDSRFLIAAHIDRWADNVAMRGAMNNALCLCLMHDRAFELGLFTLDGNLTLFVNPGMQHADQPYLQRQIAQQGRRMRIADIEPSPEALRAHWERVGILELMRGA